MRRVCRLVLHCRFCRRVGDDVPSTQSVRAGEGPMELLNRIFTHHPAALRLHRELTLSLAHGDAARAADVAAVLANCVQRLTHDETARTDSTTTSPPPPPPRPGVDDVAAAMSTMQRGLDSPLDTTTGVTVPSVMEVEPPFWRDPRSLTVTLLETAFETIVPTGEAADALTPAGNVALRQEREQLELLDLYLHKDDARWRMQKQMVVKIVLDTARDLGLTPEDLHAAEGGGEGKEEKTDTGSGGVSRRLHGPLNVLRHCNLVIRGEAPGVEGAPDETTLQARIDSELAALKVRVAALHAPLSSQDEQLARYELRLRHCTMRYVVGLHRDLQLALDTSSTLRQKMTGASCDATSGSQFFVTEVMRALHTTAHLSPEMRDTDAQITVAATDSPPSVAAVETARVLATPVLPFTFMLKCCLWFDIPPTMQPSPCQLGDTLRSDLLHRVWRGYVMRRKQSDGGGSELSGSQRWPATAMQQPNSIMNVRRNSSISPRRDGRRFSVASSHSESPSGSRTPSRLDTRPVRAERRVKFATGSISGPARRGSRSEGDLDAAESEGGRTARRRWGEDGGSNPGVGGGRGRRGSLGGLAASGTRGDGRGGVPSRGGRTARGAAAMPIVRVVTSFRGAVIPEHKGRMPRVGHTAVMYQRDVYVFGGVNDKGIYSSHLYVHEKRSLQWEERRGLGVVPLGRQNHSAIVQDEHRMLIYGGHRGLEVLDDLYAYDFRTNRWEKIVYEKSQGPGPVFLHAAVYIPATQSMAILGGFHQREHNMYVGHIFDIRNHVWSGVPAPIALNPQHLQLVTATYYEPRDAIVVIGLAEEAGAVAESADMPSVYLLNVRTLGWTKVSTASSPESPIPFHMDLVWQVFMRDFVRMGGFHDEVQQSWYFPLDLGEIEEAIMHRRSAASSVSVRSSSVSPSTLGSVRNATGSAASTLNAQRQRSRTRRRPHYGFFKLQLTDMSWSIVLTQLSKKLLHTLESSVPEVRRSVTARRRSSLLDGLRQGGGMGMSPSNDVLGRNSDATLPPLASRSGRGHQLLYSVQGDPQFQRKYVYVAYREASPRRSRRSMEYLIMHGGLHPGADYTMLMFTPLVTRVDALSAKKLADMADTRAMSNSPDSAASTFLDWLDDDDEDDTMMMGSPGLLGRGGPASSHNGGSSYMPDPSTTTATDRGALSIREDDTVVGNNTHAEESALLPILPSTRTEHNAHRVGLLFHPNNAIRNKALLPYQDCPVAVLRSEREVVEWSRDYYTDTRRWLAERLRQATAEDRQMRLLRRRWQGRNSIYAGGSETSSVDEDYYHDEEGRGRGRQGRNSSRRASRLSSSLTSRRPRSANTALGDENGGSGHPLSSLLRDDETNEGDVDSLGLHSLTLEQADEEAERAGRADFFAEKGLDVFQLYDLAPPANSDEEGSDGGLDLSRSDLNLPGLQRLRMMVKRHNEMQRLPASIFQRDSIDGIDVGDLGSAMAYVLLRNALAALPKNHSPEVQAERARRRWRFLRTLVRTGEAAFIIYRVSQMQSKMKGLPITSTPGLLMAPELNLVSTTRSFKVPSRPIPYSLPRQAPQTSCRAEMTRSGIVAYQIQRN